VVAALPDRRQGFGTLSALDSPSKAGQWMPAHNNNDASADYDPTCLSPPAPLSGLSVVISFLIFVRPWRSLLVP